MTIIQDAINQWKEKKTIENWKEEESQFARRIAEEKKIEVMGQELQRSIRVLGDQPKEEKVKLPKLVISPFTDTSIDFFLFWNQFETQTDKSYLHRVTKLSYLKKMVVPKVQLLIRDCHTTVRVMKELRPFLKNLPMKSQVN